MQVGWGGGAVRSMQLTDELFIIHCAAVNRPGRCYRPWDSPQVPVAALRDAPTGHFVTHVPFNGSWVVLVHTVEWGGQVLLNESGEGTASPAG